MSSAATDPYLDPASSVLRNLLGITDAAELARAEAALSASRLIDLELRRLPGRYDLAHLEAFHRYILGDVYEWAGQLRTVSIAKGTVFCLPQHLESYAADVFGRLAQLAHDARHHIAWVLMNPDRNTVASAAAHHGDVAPLREMLDQLTDLPHPAGPPGPADGPAA